MFCVREGWQETQDEESPDRWEGGTYTSCPVDRSLGAGVDSRRPDGKLDSGRCRRVFAATKGKGEADQRSGIVEKPRSWMDALHGAVGGERVALEKRLLDVAVDSPLELVLLPVQHVGVVVVVRVVCGMKTRGSQRLARQCRNRRRREMRTESVNGLRDACRVVCQAHREPVGLELISRCARSLEIDLVLRQVVKLASTLQPRRAEIT